jgi:hypothetical protein
LFQQNFLTIFFIKNLILDLVLDSVKMDPKHWFVQGKKVTSHQVVSAFIERMQSVHDAINCMVDSRFSAALEEAAAVDSIISCASPADIQAIGK